MITACRPATIRRSEFWSRTAWLYWSQGSATNSGVTGHDNGGGGTSRHRVQRITLSQNVWDSGRRPHDQRLLQPWRARPSASCRHSKARRARACAPARSCGRRFSNPQNTIEPVAWGFRNPYGIRFSPATIPLKGELMISENGEDERGARPTKQCARRLAIRAPERGRYTRVSRLGPTASASWIRRNRVNSQRQRAGMTTQRRQQANLCFPCSPSSRSSRWRL